MYGHAKRPSNRSDQGLLHLRLPRRRGDGSSAPTRDIQNLRLLRHSEPSGQGVLDPGLPASSARAGQPGEVQFPDPGAQEHGPYNRPRKRRRVPRDPRRRARRVQKIRPRGVNRNPQARAAHFWNRENLRRVHFSGGRGQGQDRAEWNEVQ